MSKPERKYVEPKWNSRVQAMLSVVQDHHAEENIIAMSMNESDAVVAEIFLLGVLCASRNDSVRAAAATGIGHVVRIHRRVSIPETRQILQEMLSSTIAGCVDDAIQDVDHFG